MPSKTLPRQRPPKTWRMEFTPNPRCVALVRRQVERAMTAWGCDADDTAAVVLICSELATNAVEHACVAGENFEVRVTAVGKECLIEVADPSDVPPSPASPDVEAEHGRGLQLVAALADSVGHWYRSPTGKVVWARMVLGTSAA
ncbi:ATP-binding protein [Streptomyces pathocidini]|uniref:ATP-binding protein n=1 Tax=Streptomyces pathocidini TaxID=1650571 RepID=UPI0033D8F717